MRVDSEEPSDVSQQVGDGSGLASPQPPTPWLCLSQTAHSGTRLCRGGLLWLLLGGLLMPGRECWCIPCSPGPRRVFLALCDNPKDRGTIVAQGGGKVIVGRDIIFAIPAGAVLLEEHLYVCVCTCECMCV